MTKERWRKVKSLFALALEQPPEQRRAFLAEAAGDDAELLAELMSLLEAHDRSDGFSIAKAVPLPTSWMAEEAVALDPSRSGGTYSKICSRCHSRYGPLVFVCPQDGEPLADDPAALIGVTLDGLYVIEELVGHGAMGRVYRARHELLRDRVAIKVLRSDLALNEDFVRRFMREGRAARTISHPNAVTVYDLRTTADGLTYMVQEFIDGHTLRDEMNPGEPRSLADALRVLEPVASALDEAHAHGVVHRDLKPENIMIGTVGDRDVVKLTDLGIAKLHEPPSDAVDPKTLRTEPGRVMGTPHYMPPEQWGAPPEDGGPEIDARADVYSFGVIAFELLAGRKPFDIASVRQLCLAHLSRPAPDLREYVPDVPEAAAAAVARALSKDRADRQATCGELVAALAAAAGDEPIASPAARHSGWGSAWLVAAAVVLTLLAAGGVWLRNRNAVQPVAPVAPVAPVPVALRTLACSAEVLKVRDGVPVKDPLRVSTDRTLLVEQGDRVRFTFHGPEAGYLYVLNETVPPGAERGDTLRVLFPVSWTAHGSPHVAAGAAVTLPTDEKNWIEFDDERGTDVFWVVWAAEPVAALDGVAELTNPVDRGTLTGERERAVRELLATAPRAEAEVDGETGETIVRGAAGAFVHRVELQHY